MTVHVRTLYSRPLAISWLTLPASILPLFFAPTYLLGYLSVSPPVPCCCDFEICTACCNYIYRTLRTDTYCSLLLLLYSFLCDRHLSFSIFGGGTRPVSGVLACGRYVWTLSLNIPFRVSSSGAGACVSPCADTSSCVQDTGRRGMGGRYFLGLSTGRARGAAAICR